MLFDRFYKCIRASCSILDRMYRMVHQAPWISATLLQHVIVQDAPKLNKALALRRCRNSDCYPLVCDLELLLVRLGGSRQPTHRPPHLRRNKFSFFNHEEGKIKLAFRLELKIHFLMFKNRAKTVLARKRSQNRSDLLWSLWGCCSFLDAFVFLVVCPK